MEIDNLKKALKIITSSPEFAYIIPEVRTNLVMAKIDAKTEEDVAGIPGRITAANGQTFACREPAFGASSHMARMVLNVQKHDSSKRSAINIKYHPNMVEICTKLGLIVSSYERSNEPDDVKESEGKTIPWGVEESIKKAGIVPDVIYHKGAWGKEPIICLIATDAVESALMSVCIARLFVDIKKIHE